MSIAGKVPVLVFLVSTNALAAEGVVRWQAFEFRKVATLAELPYCLKLVRRSLLVNTNVIKNPWSRLKPS